MKHGDGGASLRELWRPLPDGAICRINKLACNYVVPLTTCVHLIVLRDGVAMENDDNVRARRAREQRHSDAAVGARVASWQGSKPVTSAMCNVSNGTSGRACSSVIGVTQEALDAIEAFNAHLAKRGEGPLSLNECFTCTDCAKVRLEVSEERSATRRERTRVAIRRLKGDESASPAEEREALLWLEKVLGSGYVKELTIHLAERKSSTAKRGRAGDL